MSIFSSGRPNLPSDGSGGVWQPLMAPRDGYKLELGQSADLSRRFLTLYLSKNKQKAILVLNTQNPHRGEKRKSGLFAEQTKIDHKAEICIKASYQNQPVTVKPLPRCFCIVNRKTTKPDNAFSNIPFLL